MRALGLWVLGLGLSRYVINTESKLSRYETCFRCSALRFRVLGLGFRAGVRIRVRALHRYYRIRTASTYINSKELERARRQISRYARNFPEIS